MKSGTRLSISGSTILSQTDLLAKLFTPYNDAVEIGLLEDESAWGDFMSLAKQHPGLEWGLHFPRLRETKPIENELVSHDQSVRQALAAALITDAKRVESDGGRYILAHFPFFTSSDVDFSGVRDRILYGIEILHAVATSVGIPVVVEFKLGHHRDLGGLRYVIELGDELVNALEPLGCCLDVGDWSIAAMRCEEAKPIFDMWLTRATHLHLHGVALLEPDRYYWMPVEKGVTLPGGWDLSQIVRTFQANGGRWAVCEHTPHLVRSEQQVIEGYAWLRGILS